MVVFFSILFIIVLFVLLYFPRPKDSVKEYESIVCLFACTMLIEPEKTLIQKGLIHIRRFLIKNFSKKTTNELLMKLKEHINNPHFNRKDIRPYCIGINLKLNYQQRLSLLTTLFQICAGNGKITELEDGLISDYAKHVNIRKQDYNQIKSLFNDAYAWKKNGYKKRVNGHLNQQTQISSGTHAWALKILNLPENATREEIKRAFRQAAMQYHPDKLRNASKEEIAKAIEKFEEISKAHKLLIQ